MKRYLYLLLLVCTPVLAQSGADDELLPPDQAFALTTRAADARTIEARWDIAPGYYMYRDKFRFELLSGDATLGAVQLPPGKKKEDPSFGTVETYTKSVIARAPVTSTKSDALTLRVRITAQGCNEPVGVCYPPIKKEVSFSLPSKSSGETSGIAPSPARPLPQTGEGLRATKGIADIKSILGLNNGQEFLPVDEAFRPAVVLQDGGGIAVEFRIADGYYLYRDKLGFALSAPSGGSLGSIATPPGESKEDPHFGTVQVYHRDVTVPLAVMNASPGNAGRIEVSFQGCAEKGICYPPTVRMLEFIVPAAQADAGQPSGRQQAVGLTPDLQGDLQQNDTGRASLYFAAIAGAFGIGLLLSFTPCVLPMIPILSSAIVGAGAHATRTRGGLLSLSYVLGTAVTYTAAGVLAGATGEQLQAHFQNPWAIGIVSVIFVLLALSMFGFYELQMPSFLQSRLTESSQHVHGGSLRGTFVLGLISALIVGACVSPLLISALGVAISSRDPLLGGLIMFAMALGMGVILIAVGIGLGAALPKAGAWMDRVKQVFGVLLLAVAIYLLGLLPAVPVLWLWAALFIVTGVYLGATQSLPSGASGWSYLWKGFGTVLLIWGVAALIGGFSGGRDILKPLPDWRASASGEAAAMPVAHFERMTSLAKIETALAQAQAQSRPALLDFYATWCTDCVRMEKSVFPDARAQARLKDFALLQADVTENDAEARAIKERFGIFGPPALLVFGADGSELRELRFYGYKTVDEFLAHLASVESK